MIDVLIIDDHAIVREGLKQILADREDMTVTGEADDGGKALQLLSEKKFNVAVLDISLPGRNGLEVLKEIRKLHPRTQVLMLTVHAEEQYAVRALRAGAAGYLTKESAPDELVTALQRIAMGKKYLTLSLAEHLAMTLGEDRAQPPHELLSDREYQVMCMIASGQKITRIAEELNLSVKTVSTYRARLLHKLNVSSNAEVTRYVMDYSLDP